jgi:hypothetical protein
VAAERSAGSGCCPADVVEELATFLPDRLGVRAASIPFSNIVSLDGGHTNLVGDLLWRPGLAWRECALCVPERLLDRLELGRREPAGRERVRIHPADPNLAIDRLPLRCGDRAVVDELLDGVEERLLVDGRVGAWVLSGSGDAGVLVVELFATAASSVLARGFAAKAIAPAIAPTATSATSAAAAV